MDPNVAAGIGTRTRSRVAQASASSVAAANIRQLTKSSRTTSSNQGQNILVMPSKRVALSEEQQRDSVKAVFDMRVKLFALEQRLRSELESEGFEIISSENAHEQYAVIRSIRLRADSICESLMKDPTEQLVAELREIIKFVHSIS